MSCVNHFLNQPMSILMLKLKPEFSRLNKGTIKLQQSKYADSEIVDEYKMSREYSDV